MTGYLPKGWSRVRVADYFADSGGGTPNRGTADFWGGDIPWLSSGDIKSADIESASETITTLGLGSSAARLCRRGSVVVVVRSGILKHTLPVAILKRDAAINQDLKAFDCGIDELNQWFSICLRASETELLAMNREGTTVQSVKLDTLRNFQLPIPPLAEQGRIVSKLEALLAKVDACRMRLDRIPVILKRFRQSVLTAACDGRLTEDWRALHPIQDASLEMKQLIEVRLGAASSERGRQKIRAFDAGHPCSLGLEQDLPESWLSVCVGHIGDVQNGSTPSRKCSTYWAGIIPWVSSGEVQNGILDTTRECITEEGYRDSSVSLLPKGTVLIAMIGEGKTRCQTALLNIPACINQNIAGVILDHGLVESRYLWYWFQARYKQNREFGSGSGPQALNCHKVRELPLNLPPLEEQREITVRLNRLMAQAGQIEAQYVRAKAQVDRLTQSILAKAFRGELVPQVPNDEPADSFLNKLKAEPNGPAGPGRGRRRNS